jgi:AcrR family transcriptional regulator
MNDVAERVGMRKASLFYHFVTKDTLYEAMLDRVLERLSKAIASAYAGGGCFTERLLAATDAVTTVLAERPFAARLLLRDALDRGPALRGRVLDAMMQSLEAGAAFIRAGQDAGEFVAGDAKQILLTTLGAQLLPFALGEVVQRYVGTSPFDPSFVAARCAEARKNVSKLLVAPIT